MIRILLIFTLLLCACNNTTTIPASTNYNSPSLTPFDRFLKKFETNNLPLIVRACEIKENDYPLLSPITDTPFVTTESRSYSTFKSNGDYIPTVSLGFADCSLPILTTYNKYGKQIDQKTLAIGYCGSGPGYSCHEFMTIRSDYSIYASDTISEAEVDSVGEIIQGGKTNNYIIFKNGRLIPNGKIELTDEIKKIIEK
jgi:hypothetical protein